MTTSRRTLLSIAVMAGVAAAWTAPVLAQSESRELRMGIQNGLTYLPFSVMEHEKLLEKHAAQNGLSDLKVTWFRSAGGPTLNDGLIAGNLDTVSTGISGFLTIWDKGKTSLGIRGIASYGYTRLGLVTRNPAINSLKDFTEKDRIAVPAVKSSIQAIMLQMASEKVFGPGNATKLDPLTISRSHPDAMAALLSNTEINSHFAAPPYLLDELKRPGIKLVITSEDIFGGPVSNGILYTVERFNQRNPIKMKALWSALQDAMKIINENPKGAAEMYLAVTKETTSVENIMEILRAPGTKYDEVPRGVVQTGQFMKSIGSIASAPSDWKEAFLPIAHGLPGN